MDGSGPVEVRAPEQWQTARRGAQIVHADGTVLMHADRGKGVSFYGSAVRNTFASGGDVKWLTRDIYRNGGGV